MTEARNIFAHAIFALGTTIFALAPISTAQAYTEIVLYNFTGGSDGAYPESNLITDELGNLFGTTFEGGGGCTKCGTVFKLAPDGTESVIYAFKGEHDGKEPAAGLVEDGNGNLYGTTTFVGGTVFEVTQQGVHTILHQFQGKSDGDYPLGSLIFDSTGNLYGTASGGGSSTTACDGACGTVFEITTAGTFKVLYSFQGGMDGESPRSSLIFDGAGNLYGTTLRGGRTKCFGGLGCGTVFKLGRLCTC